MVWDEQRVGLLLLLLLLRCLLLLLLEVMVMRVRRRLVVLGLVVVVLLMCRLWPGSLPTPSLLWVHRRTFGGSAHALNRTVTRKGTGTHGELRIPRPEQNRCTNCNVSKMEMEVKLEMKMAMWAYYGSGKSRGMHACEYQIEWVMKQK